MTGLGWFAEPDPETPAYPWRPVLQLEGTCAPDFDIWFKTKDECETWIRENVLGAGMLEER